MRTEGRPSGVAVARAIVSGSIGAPHFASSYHDRNTSSGFDCCFFTTSAVYWIGAFHKGTSAEKAGTKLFSLVLSIFGMSCVVQIRRKKVMQDLLLIYENEKRFSKGFPEAELAEYRAFGKQFAAAIKGGNAVQPTGSAATVRVRDGKVLPTDGPFAETKEQLGGYYLVEARDREEAIAMAAKIPAARFGSVEVRPI